MSEENIDNQQEMNALLKTYEENPYDPARKTPEDVMRVFYQFNVPLLPVVSRRGALIGIITKEAMTAAMSDIDRADSKKIDDFITTIAKKHTFEEITPLIAKCEEFTSINIFGEVQGRMRRAELVALLEPGGKPLCSESEIEASRDKQAMEWMIYTILEYIPRALYALNIDGKTIFFNSLFEDNYRAVTGEDEVDHEKVERLISDDKLNRCSFGSGRDSTPIFFNSELKLSYEKVPMCSNGDVCGYLLYFGKGMASGASEKIPLSDRMDAAERQIIVNELRVSGGDLSLAAKNLSVSKGVLAKKVEKFGIVLDMSGDKQTRSL
jgi:CBS domain-containing protein